MTTFFIALFFAASSVMQARTNVLLARRVSTLEDNVRVLRSVVDARRCNHGPAR